MTIMFFVEKIRLDVLFKTIHRILSYFKIAFTKKLACVILTQYAWQLGLKPISNV